MSIYVKTTTTLAALKDVLVTVDPNIIFDDPEQSGVISLVTLGNPVVVTSTAHGLVNNQTVEITAVSGSTELNTNRYRIQRIDDDSFALKGVDGTGFSAYVSGGNWATKPLKATTGYVSPSDVWPVYQISLQSLPIWIVAQDLSRPSKWQVRTAGSIDRLFYAEAMLLLIEGRLSTDELVGLGEYTKRGWEYATVRALHNNLSLGMTGTQLGPYNPASQGQPFAEPNFGHIKWGAKDYWGMYIRLAITQRIPMEYSR